MQGNQSQPSQNSVMVAAELDRRQVAEEEVGKVANLEKAVSRLQEDKVNISSKVAALEKVVTHHTTTLDHDMVPKVSNLEKDVAKKIQNNDTQLAHKVEENTREAYAIRQTLIQHMDIVGNLETDVRNLEKEVAKKNNDNSATDTQSIIKKIAVIEQNLQTMDTQIGKQFLGNDTRLTTIENHNRCKNCKSNPCLDGKPITSENFVHKAYYNGSAGTKGNSIYGHTYIGGFGEYQGEKYTGKWICYSYIKDIFPREEFTQAFTENVKSLKFSCHR